MHKMQIEKSESKHEKKNKQAKLQLMMSYETWKMLILIE